MFEALCALIREWDGDWERLKAAAMLLGLGDEDGSGDIEWVSYRNQEGQDVYLFRIRRGCVVQIRNNPRGISINWTRVYDFLEKSRGRRFLEIEENGSRLLACNRPV